jgi:hypothetical protein
MTARWHAIAYYRTNAGLLDVGYDIDELEELQPLIEAGPDWRSLASIEIWYMGLDDQLTVEQIGAGA